MVKRGEIEVELEIFLDLKWITEVAALLMNSEIKAIVYAIACWVIIWLLL